MNALEPTLELLQRQPPGLVVPAQVRRRSATLGVTDEKIAILGHPVIVRRRPRPAALRRMVWIADGMWSSTL